MFGKLIKYVWLTQSSGWIQVHPTEVALSRLAKTHLPFYVKASLREFVYLPYNLLIIPYTYWNKVKCSEKIVGYKNFP